MKHGKWAACAVTSVSEESGQEGFLEEGKFQLVLRGQEKRNNRQRPDGGKNMNRDGGERSPAGRKMGSVVFQAPPSWPVRNFMVIYLLTSSLS